MDHLHQSNSSYSIRREFGHHCKSSVILAFFIFWILQVEAKVANVNVTVVGDDTTIMAAKIEEHQNALEKEFHTKADHWSSCQSKWQHADDNLKRYESRVDKQRRQQGQSCFNADGSLAFLGGFQGESHLQQPVEIVRDLQRYCLQDMLKLRQQRVEGLLHELIESMNHDVLTGRYEEKTKEHQHLRQNLWATQNVLAALQRRIGVPLSKADIIRKVVSRKITFFNIISNFLRLTYHCPNIKNNRCWARLVNIWLVMIT